jgi:cysteinyl-tRNA synthetase
MIFLFSRSQQLSLIILSFLFLSLSPSASAKPSSWGYQLQDLVVDDLIASPFDLLVIDYSKDGTEDFALSLSEVSEIQTSGKIVVSYISIGEAEDYRYYFENNWLDSPPSWLGEENPDWEGNYKVNYWEQDWKDIVFDYIDKILSSNFNGIYLDIIDAYEYYEASRPSAMEDMISFVTEISDYAKSYSSFGDSFWIIPQNGEQLLEDEDYRSVIDAIGREDVYVIPDDHSEEKRETAEIETIESYLDLLIDDGKEVFVVDYTDDSSLISFARESAAEKGYIGYIGILDLDHLVDQSFIPTEEASFLSLASISLVILTTIFLKKSYSRKKR